MPIKEYVVFKLDNEYYGIDIHNVETIEKVMPMTRVPYTKDFVKGVINLRGNVVPVIDLRKRFDLSMKEYDENSRIIIVKLDEITVGMTVDSSSEVIQLSEKDIEEAPSLKGTSEENFVKCIGKKDKRIIMIIDLYKILDINDMEKEL
ncbi:chemotaxis protein CheW [Paramaledivibacter caminithermalis]|jgi:purine-binding chemotaxis protein CheW|uniref:Chemotaxis protein CheW n=1 Tax=Paramaledivibacter caminithermalis (strain DSM 15212 / CIP 107654 / DViRD3) TaxID=1121301 RepID=A0A1M6N6E7_PARC5|nr:chemotaxis protein CheW [Paramaledivibacter caminithermalis]SHJ91305.1 purine-binding chemotaxis protein CheW [Paramaledivibacter caminithermalis DSM 15212]